MAQAQENLTVIIGRLLRRRPHPRLEGWESVTVHIDDTRPVRGRADLLSRHRNTDLPVAFRASLLGDAAPGDDLVFRAYLSRDGARAEPDPAPGDLAITRPDG